MNRMKRIIIVLEALDYEYLETIKPPTIMNLNPHPAVSFGVGSRSGAGALLGGMLPVCKVPNCYHREIQRRWSNPFFMTTMQKMTDKQFYLTGNGWVTELVFPWIDDEQRKLNMKWRLEPEKLTSKEIVDYFLENKGESYFAYLHLYECHFPFYSPSGEGNRKEALLFLDRQVDNILQKCKDAEIVLVSDHNLPPHIVSAARDTPHGNTLKSFIATNFEETRTEGELGIRPDEIAKEVWNL